MLPFLKNKQEGSASQAVETVERKPDDDSGLDMLDAIAEDMLSALKNSNKQRFRAALAALVSHIQDQDVQQDQETLGDF